MDEQSNTQEAQASTAEKTAAESQTAAQTGAAAAGEQSQTTEAKATESAASTGEKKAEGQAVQESKPTSRRSAQYRIQQLARENAELKQQKPAAQDEGDEGKPAAEQPDISALVQKEVERRLNPFMTEHSKTADDAELAELFTGDKASERAKYESKIREMWTLPQYKDTAAADLYKIVSFDDAVAAATAKAIEQYKQADRQARDNSASGHSNTSNRTGKTVQNMSDEELLANNERVKAQN